MRRSKLETYVDVLRILSTRGPLKLTHVMYKANLNCNITKEMLDFLVQKGLIEERAVGKRRVVFAVTESGIRVLKYFHEVKKALPIVEEDARCPPETYKIKQ
jgi:predicted transcriptional regulator